MSLNRYEQALFDYWAKQPDELRFWQAKVREVTRAARPPGEVARGLERELWAHFVERSAQVPALRGLAAGRVSLLNLAEHTMRLWGPPPKAKPRASSEMPPPH
jgi:hypothetical protein